ncbi:CRISPR-associated helicase/endonuclease Cas3 [Hathewaya proteolytica]|nr:CRISPR-associated helicase/endonuclease Cas3 [Hathewaya proteolytica]
MIYAKSEPTETLREHTDALREECEVLKTSYGDKICSIVDIEIEEFWRMLDIIIEFHDLGKTYTPFQNAIRKKIGEEEITTEFENDIFHNYISPAFLMCSKLGINKELNKCVVQSIGYHHERNVIIDKSLKDKILQILNNDIYTKIGELKEEFKPKYVIKEENFNCRYFNDMENRILPKDDNYILYIMLKGLTHRLDYAASAHEKVELNSNENVGEYTEKFILAQYKELREVQKYAKKNREKNLVLIASTGMGKTETALIWINNDKAFFTLPLRVSINALFDRVSKEDIKYNYAGLLHSTSMDYMSDNDYTGYEEIASQSRLMSTKLTFSTIDQIFKFPFLYAGYEREYATLAYSKVVIDEMQAYSPEICAVLIKGIEMIHKIGGRFMIMTATMPQIYIDELKRRKVLDNNFEPSVYNTKVIRHNICLKNESIEENIKDIIKQGQSSKVLIIVNTVNRAVEIYDNICREAISLNINVDTNMLHSMYIQEHRSILEKNIKEFAKSNESGIWITTQLVEASLDIDFDVLHTDESTLDSMFQRFGRCNRKGLKSIENPNVYIYLKNVTGIGTIYDEGIVENGIELLNTEIKHNGVEDTLKISEDIKVKLVKILYSKDSLKGTKFHKKFNKALEVLDNITSYELSKNDAQRILRDIEAYTVIPRMIFDSIRDNILQEYIDVQGKLDKEYGKKVKNKSLISTLKKEKASIKSRILKKTVSIPKYRLKSDSITQCNIKGCEDIMIFEKKYDFDENKYYGKGVCIEKELSPFL